MAKLFTATTDHFKKLDILINNAGIYEFGGLNDITPEHIDNIFNLKRSGA